MNNEISWHYSLVEVVKWTLIARKQLHVRCAMVR